MKNVADSIKGYLIEFENSEYFVDEGNLQYVLATHKPTEEELLRIDYIRDFMDMYDFDVITIIEEVNRDSVFYNDFRNEWMKFRNVYDFVTRYPCLFRN